jgi:hypothetical protein
MTMDWQHVFGYAVLAAMVVTCWLLFAVLARGALGFIGRTLRGPRRKRRRG